MLTPKPTTGDTTWFVHDRFGMFIHWGLYALPARHEWVLSVEKIDPAVYAARYLPRFDPALYEPRQWARSAREAGMKYAVLTAKHHEGFCLWDSAYTDYKVTNTPYGKDLIGPFVEAHYHVYHDREAALSFLRPFEHHLYDLCVGSISEVFYGAAPHLPRGCAAQAWSVAEVLRTWVKLMSEK